MKREERQCSPQSAHQSTAMSLGVAPPPPTGPCQLTLMPEPLSWICNSLSPPSLTVTRMLVESASKQFSMSSLSAFDGL